MFRDFDHWAKYSKSPLFKELAEGYGKATGHKVVALTYYGARHTTANKAIITPADMEGMKLRVPQAPLFLMFTKSVGANATPIAFAEVYLALQNKTVDGQENPLPTIQAKKFYEVQTHINLTGHIFEALVTVIGSPLWKKLTDAEKKIFEEEFLATADRASATIRKVRAGIAGMVQEAGQDGGSAQHRRLPQGRAAAPQRCGRRRGLDQGAIRPPSGDQVATGRTPIGGEGGMPAFPAAAPTT